MTATNDKVMPWRIMGMWGQIDGDAIACENPSILVSSEMLNPDPSTPLGRFVDNLVKYGFNAMDLRDHPEEHTQAIVNFSKYLNERGIKLLLGHSWTEFENGGLTWVPVERTNTGRRSIKLCPFNEDLRDYWRKLVAKEAATFPGLAGYKFVNSENHYANGTPWMCDCPKCQTLSRQDRYLAAVDFLAGLLAEHDAILLWNNHQDDPWGQYREIEVFSGLNDRLPKNAQIAFSETYWDQEPGWPANPFFQTLTAPDSNFGNYMIRFQLPGQYRGMAEFPCCMVDLWEKVFKDARRFKLSGFWCQGFLATPEPDYPLNMVNWYALGRFACDPDATADQILTDWASENYSAQAAPAVVELLRLTYEASAKLFMCEGLMFAHFSAMPSLAYLDSHMCGPYRKAPRVKNHIGVEFPLDKLYPPEMVAKFKADPATRLIFGRELITPQVKARAIAEKDDAVKLVAKMVRLWESVKDKVDPEKHAPILKLLKANLVDAKVFRAATDIYFDYKLGSLTEAKIDEVVASFEGQKGYVVPDPAGPAPTAKRSWEEEVARNLRSFAEELRTEIREPWLEELLTSSPRVPGIGYSKDE